MKLNIWTFVILNKVDLIFLSWLEREGHQIEPYEHRWWCFIVFRHNKSRLRWFPRRRFRLWTFFGCLPLCYISTAQFNINIKLPKNQSESKIILSKVDSLLAFFFMGKNDSIRLQRNESLLIPLQNLMKICTCCMKHIQRISITQFF